MADLGIQHPTASLEKVDPDAEHNLRRYHCHDTTEMNPIELDFQR